MLSCKRSRRAYASLAANFACVSLICLSFSPIIQRCLPLSLSRRASSVVNRAICCASTPPSPPPPPNQPPDATLCRAASDSSTVTRVLESFDLLDGALRATRG